MTITLPTSIEQVAPADLIEYARNSRTHSAEQIDALAASIREFGFTNPVLIDEDNLLIAGHGRLAAAHQLGMESVPAIRLTHLTPDQRRAYVIADNRLAEGSGWDMTTLARELEDLAAAGYETAMTGFSDADIAELLGQSERVSADTVRAAEAAAATGAASTPTAQFEREMADQTTRGQIPIVPQYAEHHTAFVILCDNSIDEAWLRNLLQLEQPLASGRAHALRPAHVTTVQRLREALQ